MLAEHLKHYQIHPQVLEHYDFKVFHLQNCRGIICLHTDQGRKCLKRFKFSEPELIFSYQAIEHLVKKGFKNVARFIPTRSGHPYLNIEGQLYFLTDWIHGEHCDYENFKELSLASKTLARLHLASHGFEPPPGCEEKIRWGRWPEIFAHRLEELAFFGRQAQRDGKENPHSRLYWKYLAYFTDQASQSLSLLSESSYNSLVENEKALMGFCHHDFANHNVLLTARDEVYVVDFDYTVCDIRAHDIASLLSRVARHQEWTPRIIPQVLEPYRSVSPLKPGELGVIHAFLTFPQDFWQLGVWLYLEKVRPDDDRIRRRIRSMSEYVHARTLFLQKLKRLADLN